MLPVERRRAVGHEVFIHFDAQMREPADRVLRPAAADQPHDRVLDVVVAERRDASAGARRRRHFLRVGEVRAPSAFRTRHACPPSAPRSPSPAWNWFGVVMETMSMSGAFTASRQSPDARAKPNSRARRRQDRRSPRRAEPAPGRHVAEHRGDGIPGQRMAFAHIAGADQRDAQRSVHHAILSIPYRQGPPRASAIPCRPPSDSAASRC